MIFNLVGKNLPGQSFLHLLLLLTHLFFCEIHLFFLIWGEMIL